jgi:hypothetical protein
MLHGPIKKTQQTKIGGAALYLGHALKQERKKIIKT